jgi:predicted transcriptional regulator
MMKATRRDTLKIISDLLENMREPRRLTHLLYASNLSYTQLIKYIKIVNEMGLVTEQKKPFPSYIVTQDGEFFVQMVRKRQVIKIENS